MPLGDAVERGAVASGQVLLEIGDPRGLQVEADVLSADAVRIRPGTRVVFELQIGEKVACCIRTIGRGTG